MQVRSVWWLALVAPLTVGCSNQGGTAESATTGETAMDGGMGSGSDSGSGSDAGAPSFSLPVDQLEQIVGAHGHVSGDVLDIEIERTDLCDAQGPRGVTLTPSFEEHGDLYFQDLGGGNAFLNGDMALLESEVNPFIRALIDQGLVFQAYHQHMPMQPQLWFVHFRGTGEALALARKIRAAIDVTATPLPQPPPSMTTPLDPERLASILHGEAEVGDEGVVTVTVPRTDVVVIDGIRVSPEAGISTTIEFKPTGGDNAQVVPDFSMTSEEVMPVVTVMLKMFDWFQGCLYNQETAEQPQLYFDHMIKQGNAYDLAREIRLGLDRTRSQ